MFLKYSGFKTLNILKMNIDAADPEVNNNTESRPVMFNKAEITCKGILIHSFIQYITF